MKVITIGGATEDIFLKVDSIDTISIKKGNFETVNFFYGFGEKIDIKSIHQTTGGGATNSAFSFKKLGFDVCCFCNIGDDNAGKRIIQELDKENIETNNIILSKDVGTAITTIINADGEESLLFCYRGANCLLQEKDIPLENIKNSDLIYITSLSNGSAKLLPKITSFAKKNNVFVVVNPGSSQLTYDVETLYSSFVNIDILVLNCSEAKKVMLSLINSGENFNINFRDQRNCKSNCHVEVDSQDPYLIDNYILYENSYFNINAFCKTIIRCGIKTVVITNGKNGVYVAHENSIYFCKSVKTDVVDTVGAGDSFGSCFVASLQKGFTIEESLKNGIVNSGSVLSKTGAKEGLCTFELLQKLLKEKESELVIKRFEL